MKNLIKRIVFKEIIVYFLLFVLFTLLLHPDILLHPLERFNKMAEAANYAHPLRYIFLIYLLIGFFRIIYLLVKKLTHKS